MMIARYLITALFVATAARGLFADPAPKAERTAQLTAVVSRIDAIARDGYTDAKWPLVRKQIDAISMHYYTLPTGDWNHKGSATEFGEAEWHSTLARTLHIEELIQKHSAIMDKYDPQKRVGLMVDEWGTWYDPEPGREQSPLYQQNSLRDALVAGLNLTLQWKMSLFRHLLLLPLSFFERRRAGDVASRFASIDRIQQTLSAASISPVVDGVMAFVLVGMMWLYDPWLAGVAIVRVHNIWAGGWPVSVTILGWLAVLGGLARMFFPIRLAALAGQIGQSTGFIAVSAVVILALGAFLSFKAYSRD